jgi:hypothetical protein
MSEGATGAAGANRGADKFIFVPLPQYNLTSSDGGSTKITLATNSKISTFNKQSNTVVKANGFMASFRSVMSRLLNLKPDPSFGQKHKGKMMSDVDADALLRSAQDVKLFNPYKAG